MTVGDLAAWLDAFAPRALAESWDNVGLLWGDPSATIARVMTCLTVTPVTAGEAIDRGAGAIVSHHPILFHSTRAILADHEETGPLWHLARAGVAVLSPHTAFDNTRGGINDLLAARLGLEGVGPLRPSPPGPRFKVVVFVPETDREAVLTAAFAAGAGRIGAYEQCSFSAEGFGTFFGTEGANPAVGQAGRRQRVAEWRAEVVCPGDRLGPVLAAIHGAHSYEEPAIDAYPVHDEPRGPGVGRVGRLPAPESLEALAARVAAILDAGALQFAGDPTRPVERVAVSCGAGDDFLRDATRAGADVLLTGEARFHRALEAEAMGIGLIVAGHHATERPGVEDLARRIAEAWPVAEVWASLRERDPLRRPPASAPDRAQEKPPAGAGG